MSDTIRLLLTIDVEEEGLFGCVYARTDARVRNVAWLAALIPLLHETDLPVTLLCTHSVFVDAHACRVLDSLRAACRVEIGAHLHYWNTPPFNTSNDAAHDAFSTAYKKADSVPHDSMLAKLHSLFAAGQSCAGQPLTSFRMGKWDIYRAHWPLLAACGVRVDASVRPLHCALGGPDHFSAPPQPYTIPTAGAPLVEVPLTCAPMFPHITRWVSHTAHGRMRPLIQKCACLSVLPVYHPLWYMQWATRLLVARGIRVITLAWHSSEMMPGGAPHIPNAAAAKALLVKLRRYILWLRQHWHIEGATLDDMRTAPAPLITDRHGDYTV